MHDMDTIRLSLQSECAAAVEERFEREVHVLGAKAPLGAPPAILLNLVRQYGPTIAGALIDIALGQIEGKLNLPELEQYHAKIKNIVVELTSEAITALLAGVQPSVP